MMWKANHLPGKNQLRLWRKYLNYFVSQNEIRASSGVSDDSSRYLCSWQTAGPHQCQGKTRVQRNKLTARYLTGISDPAKPSQLTGIQTRLPTWVSRSSHATKERRVGQRLPFANEWPFVFCCSLSPLFVATVSSAQLRFSKSGLRIGSIWVIFPQPHDLDEKRRLAVWVNCILYWNVLSLGAKAGP